LAVVLLGANSTLSTALGPTGALIAKVASWPLIIVAIMVGLALVYRYGPSRDPVQIRWISWGSVVVVVSWVIMSALFSVYVANFGHYNKTYGALGAVAGFMTWLYLSFLILLAGAELNAEIEHQTAVDTTEGQPQPIGARKAEMADTVGAAQDGR
jgi:membrane protein